MKLLRELLEFEVLVEFISKSTFDIVVKRVCAAHGIKKFVKTKTSFDHDTGILNGSIVIDTDTKGNGWDTPDRVVNLNAKGQNATITHDLIQDIFEALKKYGATKVYLMTSKWNSPVEYTPSLDLADYVLSSNDIFITVVFGKEEVVDFNEQYSAEVKQVLEAFKQQSRNWNIDDSVWYVDVYPGPANIVVCPRGLPEQFNFSDLHDDPDVGSELDSLQRGSHNPRTRMVRAVKETAPKVQQILKDFIAQFNLKALTLKLEASDALWHKTNGLLLDKPDPRKINGTAVSDIGERVEKAVFIIRLRKDLKKFDTQK
jgi:hypothetical protein